MEPASIPSSRACYPSLVDRAVIVTGGASGIGAAIVRAFVQQRARVAFIDRDAAAAERLCAEIGAAPGAAPLFFECDLLDIEALRATFRAIEERLGPAAVLVNNAACDQRQDFGELTVDQFDWMMGVNLRHVVFAAQSVADQMRRRGGGAIVNLTSVAWMRGIAAMQCYSAAKAAIVGFTNSLARELGPDRIRVNAIAPGLVLTERQRDLWFTDETAIAAATANQSLPDPIEPDDIASLCLYLAADDSRMITKQCLSVNAGSL